MTSGTSATAAGRIHRVSRRNMTPPDTKARRGRIHAGPSIYTAEPTTVKSNQSSASGSVCIPGASLCLSVFFCGLCFFCGLKQEPQRELNVPPVVRFTGGPAEVRVCDIRVRTAQVRVVQEVEDLRPELDF